MMDDLESLKARPGERVAPKWEGLIRYLRRITQLRAGRDVRLKTGPDGTSVIADQRGALFVPHFKVSLQAQLARVGAGLISGRMPLVSGVRLDGKSTDGKDDKTVPGLPLTGGPDAALRSWVVVTVRVDLATGLLAEAEEALGIAHRNDVLARLANGYCVDEGGVGFYPLALLIWRDKRNVLRVHQNTMHDLQHAFVKAAGGRPARHYFWPA
jgi:hypothetical protein